MGKQSLTMGEGPHEGCGHRKIKEAIVKLWPSVKGIEAGE